MSHGNVSHAKDANKETPAAAQPPVSSIKRPWLLAAVVPPVVGFIWLPLAYDLGIRDFPGTFCGCLLITLLWAATYTDLRWNKIYNWETYSAALWVLGLNLIALLLPADWTVTPPSWSRWFGMSAETPNPVAVIELLGVKGLDEALIGFVVCFAVMTFLFMVFHGGAGDVKLVTAIGTILGWHDGFQAIINSYIIAGVFAGSYLIWTVGPAALLGSVFRLLRLPKLAERLGHGPEAQLVFRKRIPMAPYFALGTLAMFLWPAAA